MTEGNVPIAVRADAVPKRTRLSNYPEPFFSRMAKREKRPLGDFFGLRNFGVNLTRLAPGGESALLHRHSRQDEMIFVLEGEPTLVTDRGEWSVAGAVFKGREPRLVRIDGYPLEAIPQGWMLVFANLDVPGVVGRIGTICGRNGINIAGMQLGRERRGGRAVSILNLDDPLPPAVLEEIRAMPDIVLAKLVKL